MNCSFLRCLTGRPWDRQGEPPSRGRFHSGEACTAHGGPVLEDADTGQGDRRASPGPDSARCLQRFLMKRLHPERFRQGISESSQWLLCGNPVYTHKISFLQLKIQNLKTAFFFFSPVCRSAVLTLECAAFRGSSRHSIRV